MGIRIWKGRARASRPRDSEFSGVNKNFDQADFIPIICPNCLRDTVDMRETCVCGMALPFAFVTGYDSSWDFDTDFLSRAKRYKALRLLGKYSGKNPERLSELSQIEYLALSRYKGFKFEFLREFKNLSMLELDYMMSISALDGVGEISNLELLKLIECKKVHDSSGLGQCKKLKVLDIFLCGKNFDLTPIAKCTALRWMRYEGIRLQTLDFLARLKHLETLILHTRVADDSLLKCKRLKRLKFKKGCFAPEVVAAFKRRNHECEVKAF